MLLALVAWSLKFRTVVVVLATVVLGIGVYASSRARLDVFPEFAPPIVVVQTECPGLTPVDVEQLVTIPIEISVNGVPRLAKLRSQSIQGLSVVTATFADGADVYRARQQVNERLSEVAGQLPAGVKAPRVAPLTSSTGRLLSVGFTADRKDLTPLDLRDKVQYFVRPRLLITGVAQITIMGGWRSAISSPRQPRSSRRTATHAHRCPRHRPQRQRHSARRFHRKRRPARQSAHRRAGQEHR